MNREFVAKVKAISNSGENVFSIGHNTFFSHEGNQTVVRYVGEKGTAELTLGTIEALCSGSAPFESADEDWIDRYLPLLTAIEAAINRAHRDNPGLRDKDLIPILERLVMKPDINLSDQTAQAIQDYLKLTLATNTYSRKEVTGSLKKVLRSVRNHRAVDGPKGYLNFIKDKV